MINRKDCANAIRALSMDAVEKARSGHPGAPMGMADIAEVLWRDLLRHNPCNPLWPDRDRFVLSNGHGSMLLYSLLHLSGYDLGMEDIKNFRQWGSRTAGHPEHGHAPGIETTTGPLGQGLANAVGMALAEKHLAARFNRPGHQIVDHHTYVFVGDGCLMEGISHEVCSLAGTLGLGKLVVFYDDNGISIDGPVESWFTEDVIGRFEAYGWEVLAGVDGHDPDAVLAAARQGRSTCDRPTLICCRTTIGHGSPNKGGTASCHGAPLGGDEIALVRKQLGWQHAPFEIPDEIYQQWDARSRGQAAEDEWNQRFTAYKVAWPELAAEFERCMSGTLPDAFSDKAQAWISQCQQASETLASRRSSLNTLNAYGPLLPELIGGSADLAGSNLTHWKGCSALSKDETGGNYVHYGVREFGMTAMTNGMALHGGVIPYGSTFLVFMEYACNAVRMAALMKQRVIQVYTHDSIGLGEDGPTHQPVEQLASLRQTPGLHTWRPCDTVETAVAWKQALERSQGPSALVLSRQDLVCIARDEHQLQAIERGGYILSDSDAGEPELILMATGSEVSLICQAGEQLRARGHRVRVISMPCTEVFDAQDEAYRNSVLPPHIRRRLIVEAAVTDFWYKYAGLDGKVLGMTSFGASAPASDLFKSFGFTVERVLALAEDMLNTGS